MPCLWRFSRSLSQPPSLNFPLVFGKSPQRQPQPTSVAIFAWRSDLWRTGLRTAPHPDMHFESWLPQRKQQIIHRKSSSIVGATTYELDYSTTAVPYPHCRAKHEAAQASSSLSKLTNLSQRALAMNYLRAEVGRAVSCVAARLLAVAVVAF